MARCGWVRHLEVIINTLWVAAGCRFCYVDSDDIENPEWIPLLISLMRANWNASHCWQSKESVCYTSVMQMECIFTRGKRKTEKKKEAGKVEATVVQKYLPKAASIESLIKCYLRPSFVIKLLMLNSRSFSG